MKTETEINLRLRELRQREHALRSHEAYCSASHLLHGDVLEELGLIHGERVGLNAELAALQTEDE